MSNDTRTTNLKDLLLRNLLKANKTIEQYVINSGDDENTIFNKKSRYKKHNQGPSRLERRLAKKKEKRELAKKNIKLKEDLDKKNKLVKMLIGMKKALVSTKLLSNVIKREVIDDKNNENLEGVK